MINENNLNHFDGSPVLIDVIIGLHSTQSQCAGQSPIQVFMRIILHYL